MVAGVFGVPEKATVSLLYHQLFPGSEHKKFRAKLCKNLFCSEEREVTQGWSRDVLELSQYVCTVSSKTKLPYQALRLSFGLEQFQPGNSQINSVIMKTT